MYEFAVIAKQERHTLSKAYLCIFVYELLLSVCHRLYTQAASCDFPVHDKFLINLTPEFLIRRILNVNVVYSFVSSALRMDLLEGGCVREINSSPASARPNEYVQPTERSFVDKPEKITA